MEDHILDIGKRQWVKSRYGLTLIGTWVQLAGGWRPCIAIIRDGKPEFKPCVIPLDNAWQWSTKLGNPYPRAEAMLVRLGVDPYNGENVHKLIALVNDRMYDLVSMPPRPQDAEEHDEPVVDIVINSEISGKTEVEL